jgi:small subunit ribosomal protein S16
MVRIRLTRMGKKKQPFYRIVVVDSRRRRDGKYIESLGFYNPKVEPAVMSVDVEKAAEWILKGAQPSETARSVLSKLGVMKKVHELKSKAKEE